jgi:hypothetical protein
MLDVLRRIWESNPDLRLAQIISNAARSHRAWPDVFNIEDQELMKGLESLLKQAGERRRGAGVATGAVSQLRKAS